jgi:hypothetical protein
MQFADRISRSDFRFVSGSAELVCDRFQAAFVSPRICQMIMNDHTTNEFVLNEANSNSLEFLGQLIVGADINVSESDLAAFD